MDILHVASFSGNNGDIANHYGFRKWFDALFSEAPSWKEFEIREVYRKQVAFDESFAKLANSADLVIIGGGNYFELWVENSPTGTSISIEMDILNLIKTPIFFNALGVDDGMGVTKSALGNFNHFLDKILSSEKYLVSVRNDGAFDTLKKHVDFDNLPIGKVLQLPDGGFFVDCFGVNSNEKKDMLVGLNLACDMKKIRYPGVKNLYDYNGFLNEMANFMVEINKKYKTVRFILFPHVYSDLKIYSDLLNILPDKIRREKVIVDRYNPFARFSESIFMNYSQCEIVLATRFHANVVSLSSEVPTIGLYSYKQIKALYKGIDMEKYLINVQQYNFSKELLNIFEEIISNKKSVMSDLRKAKASVLSDRQKSIKVINKWLVINKLKAGV
jgi:polysaccharide pyruvyl transferase WcaK-like protein